MEVFSLIYRVRRKIRTLNDTKMVFFYLILLSQNLKGQNEVNFTEKLGKKCSFQLIDIIIH